MKRNSSATSQMKLTFFFHLGAGSYIPLHKFLTQLQTYYLKMRSHFSSDTWGRWYVRYNDDRHVQISEQSGSATMAIKELIIFSSFTFTKISRSMKVMNNQLKDHIHPISQLILDKIHHSKCSFNSCRCYR
jgi:hypothetical protein